MGAWGSGPFENDDAADWAYELTDGGPEVVAAALDAVSAGPTPDAPQASRAVAAAAVVAAGLGSTEEELSDEVREWLAGVNDAAWPPLREPALRALGRVRADSELGELWGEQGDDAWSKVLAALEGRIAAAGSVG